MPHRPGGAAATTGRASEQSPSDDTDECKHFWIVPLALAVLFAPIFLIAYLSDRPGLTFSVESVSVAVVDGGAGPNSMVPAEWHIGFSVERSHGWSSFDVSVECMSRSWPGEVTEIFDHSRRNAFYLNATVNTTMPHYIVPGVIEGLKLEFDVVIWAHYEWGNRIRGLCTNMTVGFESTAEKGFLVGGRRSCALDYFK